MSRGRIGTAVTHSHSPPRLPRSVFSRGITAWVGVAFGFCLFSYMIGAMFHSSLVFSAMMFGQYLLLLPAFLNIFPIYSFCNMHDISWGTKEGNLQSETRRMHEGAAVSAIRKAERARAALERLQGEAEEAAARAKYGIVGAPGGGDGGEGGGGEQQQQQMVQEEIINMGPPMPEGAVMVPQQTPEGQMVSVPMRQVQMPAMDGAGNMVMQVRTGPQS